MRIRPVRRPLRSHRRAAAAWSAVAVVAAALVAAGPAAPAGAAPGDQFRVLHWNIAGVTVNLTDESRPDNKGSFGVVRRLVAAAETRQPHFVSMNETCWLQTRYARQQLADRFGSVEFHFADSAGLDVLCGEDVLGGSLYEAGTAILAVGAAQVWDRHTYYFAADGSISTEETERAAACLLASFPSDIGEIVRGCSVHLDPDDAIAQRQARSLVDALPDDPYPVVLAGDFNATPEFFTDSVYSPEQGGQGRFVEVDHPENEQTFYTGGKIDYVFGDDFHFGPPLAGEVIPPGECNNFFFDHPCSDHSMLFGTLTFQPGPIYPSPPFPPDPPQPPVPVDTPPFVTAGEPVSGPEGSALQLAAAADDDSGAPSVSWSYRAGADVDAGATCSFADADDPTTTITCTDDGTFTVTLTASDGVNGPVSASTTVTVRNAPPVLTIGTAPWSVYRAGTPATLQATFTDPGANDTHTCTVSWDDGSTDSGGSCAGGHVFAVPGMNTVGVTVTDDDGGSDSGELLLIVYDPDAGFVTGGAHLDSPAGALGTDPTAAGRAHVQLNPKYGPHDEGPAPGGGKVSFRLDGFDLDSTGLEWLVVTPDGTAAVKGTGTVNGQRGYGFVAYVYDDPDAFRIVVWPLSAGPVPGATVTYDNRRGASYDLDRAEPQPLTGGNLQVHT